MPIEVVTPSATGSKSRLSADSRNASRSNPAIETSLRAASSTIQALTWPLGSSPCGSSNCGPVFDVWRTWNKGDEFEAARLEALAAEED